MIVVISTQTKSYDENMEIFNDLRDCLHLKKPFISLFEMFTGDNSITISLDYATIDETLEICDDLVILYGANKVTACPIF